MLKDGRGARNIYRLNARKKEGELNIAMLFDISNCKKRVLCTGKILFYNEGCEKGNVKFHFLF